MKGSEGPSPAFPKGPVQGALGLPLFTRGARSSGTAAGCGRQLGRGERRAGCGKSPSLSAFPSGAGSRGSLGAPPLRPEQIPSAAGLGHGFPAGGLEVAQKDFGAVGSAVGTRKYGQRRPGLGGRDAPRQGAGQVQTHRPAVSPQEGLFLFCDAWGQR